MPNRMKFLTGRLEVGDLILEHLVTAVISSRFSGTSNNISARPGITDTILMHE